MMMATTIRIRVMLLPVRMSAPMVASETSEHPMSAPIVMALQVIQGFMPMSRPSILATIPPEPWKGTMTKRMTPMYLMGFIQGCLSTMCVPLVSM